MIKIGRQPVNMQLAAYYNVAKPTGAGDWQLRAQVQLLFPKYALLMEGCVRQLRLGLLPCRPHADCYGA